MTALYLLYHSLKLRSATKICWGIISLTEHLDLHIKSEKRNVNDLVGSSECDEKQSNVKQKL